MALMVFFEVLPAFSEETVFAPPSGEGASGLRLLPPETSGLTARSTYTDARAWGERLKPATIGTVGTGIGVGDFNGDGFPDLFVGIREGRNRLYLNEAGRRFYDATEQAGIPDSPDWTTGVTVVDLDGNGLPDIYVGFFDAPNRLYLNQGDGGFREVAGQAGLDVRDATSGAFFADYDRDGDLDLYLQTNIGYRDGGQPDYLFRNEGGLRFRDVTAEAGLRTGRAGATLGHSVLWLDYDGDGWEDLYVANDFRPADFLYLNNGDGTFRPAQTHLPVAPYSSMGSDLGDVNRDGRLDLLTTDMAATTYRKHVESMLTSAVKTRTLDGESAPPQVMKNALLLNRGAGRYVDVAYAWNLAATDWTWSARLADLDNDGWPDALFTNGMIRQFHNADLALRQDRQTTSAAKTAVFKRSPVLREPNLVFRNREGRGFALANDLWGYADNGVSFGAALLDYDRDGDLDWVYTNFNGPPVLWRNDLGRGDAVQVELVGRDENTQAIGAVAVAFVGGRPQAQKLLSNRGYLGTDEAVLHFGMGPSSEIERLEVTWPDGSREAWTHLAVGRRYRLFQGSGVVPGQRRPERPRFHLAGREDTGGPEARVEAGNQPAGLLYPFKPVPGPAPTRLHRGDFNGDGKPDTLILREWDSPRLILSGEAGMADASRPWGLEALDGIWRMALVEDINRDGHPDVLLGGLGHNHEMAYRSSGAGRLVRLRGRFTDDGPTVHLNAHSWGDVLRLYDGLRDFTEIEPRLLPRLRSFGDTGALTLDTFVERTGFVEEERFEVTFPPSGILMNVNGERFTFRPLPPEAQYGRVWDMAAGDVDRDGRTDLILLLGQVSPHYRSSQDEGSFLYVFMGNGDGAFRPDSRPPLAPVPPERIVGVSLAEDDASPGLELLLEDGTTLIYTVN